MSAIPFLGFERCRSKTLFIPRRRKRTVYSKSGSLKSTSALSSLASSFSLTLDCIRVCSRTAIRTSTRTTSRFNSSIAFLIFTNGPKHNENNLLSLHASLQPPSVTFCPVSSISSLIRVNSAVSSASC